MVTAAAVLASYLLVRVAADPRPTRFASYGLSLVLLAGAGLAVLRPVARPTAYP